MKERCRRPPEDRLTLQELFARLDAAFGDLDWWPAEHAFEVVVGAILTQNTAWTNVELALDNLKHADALTPQAIVALPRHDLEVLIKPAGFFRQKARYLHGISACLTEHFAGDVGRLCDGPLDSARRRLLSLTGIGPETADSILLYAAARPSFVVDAYTRRILTRLGLLQGGESYASIRARFMAALPKDVPLFNQYHALLVEHAKIYCRKNAPLCPHCPLTSACVYGTDVLASGSGTSESTS